MNRLDDEHLHLLLDESIYVLADHGDHPAAAVEEANEASYTGDNAKGICIFATGASDDDLAFLFKGLNALNIAEVDIALFREDYDSLKDYPAHQKRLRFSKHTEVAKAFNVVYTEDLATLSSITLEEIKNNQDFKRKFWEALKVIFKEA